MRWCSACSPSGCPRSSGRKALTYGLVGAFVFRFLAIAVATFLLKWRWVKLLGGGYLAYIAVKHLFFEAQRRARRADRRVARGRAGARPRDRRAAHRRRGRAEELEERTSAARARRSASRRPREGVAKFWPTVFVIELTDIAFAVDSILAAIGVVGSAPPGHPEDALHPKLWVIITGGILGVILMRFAAVIFIRLLETFPAVRDGGLPAGGRHRRQAAARLGLQHPGAPAPDRTSTTRRTPSSGSSG